MPRKSTVPPNSSKQSEVNKQNDEASGEREGENQLTVEEYLLKRCSESVQELQDCTKKLCEELQLDAENCKKKIGDIINQL
eukprot:jgi/Galph1/5618/GphlegSOOS_G4271.1